MKKGLILLPLAAFMLSSCMLMPGKSSSSSGGGGGGGQGGGGEDTGDTEGGGGDVEAKDFDLSSGTHTAVLNFKDNPDNYKDVFPFVDKDTGPFERTVGGLDFGFVSCFVGSYNGAGYLMMQNNKSGTSWSQDNGNAYFASKQSLGAITSIAFTCGANASTAQSYVVSLGKEPFSSAQSSGVKTVSHPGTQSTPITAQASDGYSYFAISTKDGAKNGQIATLTVTYTI